MSLANQGLLTTEIFRTLSASSQQVAQQWRFCECKCVQTVPSPPTLGVAASQRLVRYLHLGSQCENLHPSV